MKKVWFLLFLSGIISLTTVRVWIGESTEIRRKAGSGFSAWLELSAVDREGRELEFFAGETFEVEVVLFNPKKEPIVAADIVLGFDQRLIQVVEINPQATAFSTWVPVLATGEFQKEAVKRKANQSGSLSFGGLTFDQQSNQVTAPVTQVALPLAKIFFQAKARGETQLSLVFHGLNNSMDCNLVKKGLDQGVDILKESLAGQLSVRVNEPEQTPILGFKVRFNGAPYNLGEQLVGVKIVGPDVVKEFEAVKVVSSEKGVLQGQVVLNGVPAGKNYAIFIKGPKHLATKFCYLYQKKHCSGLGELSLAAGGNDFNLSNLPLLAGDIPDKNGVQDEVVDAADFNRLKRALISLDPSLRKRANLNFNTNSIGQDIVNGADIALFLETLSVRYDDD